MRALRFIPFMAAIVALVAFSASAEKPVLRVNDTQLTDTDLKLAQQVAATQMQRQNPRVHASPEEVMKRTVDQLIRQTLLLQAAHGANITADPEEVKAEVDQQRTRLGAATFDTHLAELGLTSQEFAQRIEDQMVVRKFVETTVASKVTVTEWDARNFYESNPASFERPEEVRVRTILFKLDPDADERQVIAAKLRAEDFRRRLVSGEDMAAMATSVSDDTSKENGGEIGWVRQGMLLPELEPGVWALKPGEVSEVLKSKLGYHLFKVEERRIPGKVSFDDVKGKVINIVKNEKVLAALEALVKERRAGAKIEALDPSIKAAVEALQPQREAKPLTATGSLIGPASNSPKGP